MISIPIWLFVLILIAAAPVAIVLLIIAIVFLIIAIAIILSPIWLVMGLKSAKMADEHLGIGEGMYNGGENDED